MDDETIALTGLAAAPIITALVAAIGVAIPALPRRAYPIVAVAIGVAWNVAASATSGGIGWSAARGGIDGWQPMVYPGAFQQPVAAAFDAAYPGAIYLGLPCAPVIQTYGRIGASAVLGQIAEAKRRGATALSIYAVETAADAELEAVAWAKSGAPADASALREAALAYLRGAVAILDHGSAAELRAWGELFSGGKK